MISSDTDSGTPQFETVEYQVAPGSNTCVLCNQSIVGPQYRVNGQQVCNACMERHRLLEKDSASNYSRALLYGIGAAIVGMIGYATFAIVTGWMIGFVSLAVGWLVGKAMLKGSGGIGGRKYQITAALLTYAAVSLGAIPIMLHQYSKEKKDHPPAQVQTQSQSPASPSADQPATGSPPQPSPSTPKTPEKPAVGTLVLLGLASPFLELADPLHGLIGLVILFVGLQIAWKMMGRPKLQIEGPL